VDSMKIKSKNWWQNYPKISKEKKDICKWQAKFNY